VPADEGDGDSDGRLDCADNCPSDPNAGQEDTDSDGTGDACDADDDGDGVSDGADNCPLIANASQADGDGDGTGDACDVCPADPANDTDGDGVCGDVDNCAGDSNPDQLDTDADGQGDACDADDDGDGVDDPGDCAPLVGSVSQIAGPVGPTLRLDATGGGGASLQWQRGVQGFTTNIYRGTIVAGEPWSYDETCFDDENPGTAGSDPGLPPAGTAYTYLLSAKNLCGESRMGQDFRDGSSTDLYPSVPCAAADRDTDQDTIEDLQDNCPETANSNQSDADQDFTGDACDVCVNDPGDDIDGDGVCGDVDNCPNVPNSAQADSDSDGIGDVCDAEECDGLDNDGDGSVDEGFDADSDTIADCFDNCPSNANAGQEDADGDGTGDACDTCTDTDGDGFGDPGFPASTCTLDNCPAVSNPSQTDTDGDGTGDACEPETQDVRVSASSDDAEEDTSGNMDLTSSDLELIRESTDQLVGMRFNNMPIPQGATIVSATIQFQVDETTSETTTLTIQGQDIDNAPTFTSSNGNISSRARTTASVGWSPPPWNSVGQAGPDQRTPDISAVIEEIVARPGWSSGNSLVIIITGSGKRVAESYNGVSSAAALLHVEYIGN
jgi:hypothetical protein